MCRKIAALMMFVLPGQLLADNLESLLLYYDEFEKGVGMQPVRYMINQHYLRIDNGEEEDDFVLYDVEDKLIYSVNHSDQTILKISSDAWQRPEMSFKFSEQTSVMEEAPMINKQKVHQYQLKTADKTCTQVFYLKGLYPAYMKVIYDYQQVLSGQQVATLKNTPEEMRTPCFLLDQVYHTGDYFLEGLPIQITYSRDYAKFLKHYETKGMDSDLFELPEDYREYLPFAR